MGLETDAMASTIVDTLRTTYQKAWNEWSQSDRELVYAVAKDAAKIAAFIVAGKDMSPEKAQIDAQLANINVALTKSASRAMWEVIGSLLTKAATILLK